MSHGVWGFAAAAAAETKSVGTDPQMLLWTVLLGVLALIVVVFALRMTDIFVFFIKFFVCYVVMDMLREQYGQQIADMFYRVARTMATRRS